VGRAIPLTAAIATGIGHKRNSEMAIAVAQARAALIVVVNGLGLGDDEFDRNRKFAVGLFIPPLVAVVVAMVATLFLRTGNR
jgi:hypothetical protein